MITEGSFPRQ